MCVRAQVRVCSPRPQETCCGRWQCSRCLSLLLATTKELVLYSVFCCFRQHISGLCGTEFQISSLCVICQFCSDLLSWRCSSGKQDGFLVTWNSNLQSVSRCGLWVRFPVPGCVEFPCSPCVCLGGFCRFSGFLLREWSYACKPCSLISMWLLHLFSTRWRSHISAQLQLSAVFRRPGGGDQVCSCSPSTSFKPWISDWLPSPRFAVYHFLSFSSFPKFSTH